MRPEESLSQEEEERESECVYIYIHICSLSASFRSGIATLETAAQTGPAGQTDRQTRCAKIYARLKTTTTTTAVTTTARAQLHHS